MRALVLWMSCVDGPCDDTAAYDILWNVGILASIVAALVVTIIWIVRERRK